MDRDGTMEHRADVAAGTGRLKQSVSSKEFLFLALRGI